MSYDADERYLPTIRQIIDKGDSCGNVPLSNEECADWFEATYNANQRRRKESHEHLGD